MKLYYNITILKPLLFGVSFTVYHHKMHNKNDLTERLLSNVQATSNSTVTVRVSVFWIFTSDEEVTQGLKVASEGWDNDLAVAYKNTEHKSNKKPVKSALFGHSGPNKLELNDSCDSKCEIGGERMSNSPGLGAETGSSLKTHGFRKLPLQTPTVEFDTSVKNTGRNTLRSARNANTSVVLLDGVNEQGYNAVAFPRHFRPNQLSIIPKEIITLNCEYSKDQACCVLVYNSQLDVCRRINKICVCHERGRKEPYDARSGYYKGENEDRWDPLNGVLEWASRSCHDSCLLGCYDGSVFTSSPDPPNQRFNRCPHKHEALPLPNTPPTARSCSELLDASK